MAGRRIQRAGRRSMAVPLSIGVAIGGAGLAPPSVAGAHRRPVVSIPVRLASTSTDMTSSLADSNLALVMGPSTIPIPTQGYMDLADKLYLEPLGFHGTLQALATPEGLNPVTGVKSLTLDDSVNQGKQILTNAIQQGIHNGTISPEHPVTVFGWSQSSTISALDMQALHDAGIPRADVHFVLVGDPNNPDGGMLDRFAVPIDGHDPTAPALGITFSGTTPSDLYPTDIYTNEYDGFADFPKYPANFLSDLNAYLGILFQHIAYLGLSPDQIAPQSTDNPDGAILLPGSHDLDPTGDSLTNYWMIPDQQLPLLQILNYIPFIGKPLYDLLEPAARIEVNLGYGSIDDGWSPGDASTSTQFVGGAPDIDQSAIGTAMSQAWEKGFTDAWQQLTDPSNWSMSDYLAGIEHDPFLSGLVTLTHALDLTSATQVSDLFNLPTLLELGVNGLAANLGFPTSDTSLFDSSFTDVINSLTGTLSGDYATLLPIADTVNTLFTTVPGILFSFVSQELADGNFLAAVQEPIAAATALVPFAAIFGIGVPIVGALGGTLVNVAELLGLGGDAGGAAGEAGGAAGEATASSFDPGDLLG